MYRVVKITISTAALRVYDVSTISTAAPSKSMRSTQYPQLLLLHEMLSIAEMLPLAKHASLTLPDASTIGL